MDILKALITEIPGEGYDREREGVIYPGFKSCTYFSATAGRDTKVSVMLPTDYDESRQYPVLYVLHGFYDDGSWMTRDEVKLAVILKNLQLDDKAQDMIVVAPYIFCSREMPVCTGMDLENCYAYDNFINDLTTDLMPFIEDRFSVKKGRENTAITGFSMGGREAMFIGFKRPDLFGYIGAVCPAPGLVEIPGSPMHPGQLTENEMRFDKGNEPFAMLVSYSLADEVVLHEPEHYHRILENNKVTCLFQVMKETGHEHTSVKPHLYNFLRLLFR